MKKKTVALLMIIATVALMLSACLNRGGDVRDVERIVSESVLYTQEDIETAMDIAIEHFSEGYEGCKLLKIAYDEEETINEIDRQRERYGDIKLLILVSAFYAGDEAEGGFERNMTYNGWKWIFRNDGDGWKLVNWGFA